MVVRPLTAGRSRGAGDGRDEEGSHDCFVDDAWVGRRVAVSMLDTNVTVPGRVL